MENRRPDTICFYDINLRPDCYSEKVILTSLEYARITSYNVCYTKLLRIHKLVKIPVWSLADYQFFKGALGDFLEKVGAVSTKNPHRDSYNFV